MPPINNFEFSVVGPSRTLFWSGGQGSAKVVQQGDHERPTLIDMDLSWPDGPAPGPIPHPVPVPTPIPSLKCPVDADFVNENECIWQNGSHGLKLPASAQAYCGY